MTDLLATNRKVRELVRLTLGMPGNSVRPANQGAPADGTEQFATVLLTVLTPTGWDDTKFENTAQTPIAAGRPVLETIHGQRRVMASVQFFRGNAYEQALRLSTLLQSSAAQERMSNAGLGLIRLTDAKDLTALNNTKFESRGQIDLELHLIAGESMQTPTFGQFPISVKTPSSTVTNEVLEP